MLSEKNKNEQQKKAKEWKKNIKIFGRDTKYL